MKKSNKNSIIALLMFIVMLSSLSLGVNASSDDVESVSGAKEATTEQMQLWEFSEKDINNANRTLAEALASAKVQAKASTWIYTDRYFYYYGQETNYSCGPASVKMALRNITGNAYSEAAIRTGCSTTTSGTYLSDMVTYINSMQSHNFYLAKYRQDKTTMQTQLYSGIVNWDAPPIIGLKETTSNGWNYNLGRHFVTIFAVTDNKARFAVTDPWSGYIGDSDNRDIMVSVDTLYSAYNAVNLGYMF